jgi:hypothetical protein
MKCMQTSRRGSTLGLQRSQSRSPGRSGVFRPILQEQQIVPASLLRDRVFCADFQSPTAAGQEIPRSECVAAFAVAAVIGICGEAGLELSRVTGLEGTHTALQKPLSQHQAAITGGKLIEANDGIEGFSVIEGHESHLAYQC